MGHDASGLPQFSLWGLVKHAIEDLETLHESLAGTHVGMAFYVIGAETADELATVKTAGATHGLVQAIWATMQPTEGEAVDVSSLTTAIRNVRAAGLKVCFEVALQYPPTFVTTNGVKLKDEDDNEWTAGGGSGANIRDWIWSATTRAYVEDFLDKLFVQLDWSLIERMRLGGLDKGEMAIPQTDSTAKEFWGYSGPAQTGTAIAAGMAPCPVPGQKVSATPTFSDDDRTFVAWYNQSIVNWMQWYIAKHREYFAGPIWVLHPAAGLRPVSQTPTSESQGDNFRQNSAQGLDWHAQIAGYPDDGIWPYSTWADSDHFWAADPYSITADGNAAPFLHLLRVARVYGRAGRIGGENTGGQDNADMDRMFEDGAVAHGYEFVGWFNHGSLASAANDTYANLTTQIGKF